MGDVRCDFLEQSEQFCSQAWLKNVEAGQVSTWMGQAGHQVIHDRIAAGDENHGNRATRLLHRLRGRSAIRQYHVRGESQQLRGGGPHPIGVAEAPLKINLNVAAQMPAELLESLLKCRSTE